MNHFFEFVIGHWELWLIFFAVLVALIAFELKEKTAGGARLSPQTATDLVNRQSAVVIDIRDKSSFKEGHIVNAHNMPAETLDSKTKSWEKYKQKPVIICCAKGQQANVIGTKLRKMGFAQVNILQGGIQAWKDAGMPITKG